MKPREYYLNLLHTHIKNPKMIAHSLAAEAVMKALARKFGEDEELWGLAGLLHDIDVEWTQADPLRHGPEGAAFCRNMVYRPRWPRPSAYITNMRRAERSAAHGCTTPWLPEKPSPG